MRKPTPRGQLYDWHSRALAGQSPQIIHDEPQCGWFQTRLVRGGLWVSVKIWLDQPCDEFGELCDDERLRCQVDGEEIDDIAHVWNYCAGRPISEADWQWMESRRIWALYHAPSDPAANTRRSLDPMTTPLHF